MYILGTYIVVHSIREDVIIWQYYRASGVDYPMASSTYKIVDILQECQSNLKCRGVSIWQLSEEDKVWARESHHGQSQNLILSS